MRVPLRRLRLAIMHRPRFGRLATVNMSVADEFEAATVATAVVATAVLLVLVVAAGVAVAWRHLFL